jgi:hypothetical protein
MQVSVCVQGLLSSHALPVSIVHTPSAVAPVAIAHESHAPPLHAVLQQTPSAQLPLWQEPAERQAEPSGSGEPHLPPMQRLPAVQSVSTTQVVLQAAPTPQMYGAHGVVPFGVHVPVPLQSEPLLSVLPEHDAATHEIPFA